MTGFNHSPVCQPEAVMFVSSVYNFGFMRSDRMSMTFLNILLCVRVLPGHEHFIIQNFQYWYWSSCQCHQCISLDKSM